MNDLPKPPFQSTEPTEVRFNFSCTSCGSVLEATSIQCGTPGRCPTCAFVFTIPQVDLRTGLAVGRAEDADSAQDPTPVHAYAAAGDKAPDIVRLHDGSQSIVCSRCKGINGIDTNYCSTCGFPFTMEGANRAAVSPTGGLAFVWFFIALVSFPLCFCTVYGAPGAFAAGVGSWASLSRINSAGRPSGGRGLAIGGVILASLGLVVAMIRVAWGI